MAGRLNMAAGRLNKELKDLECKPPEGVICYPVNDSMVHLHAELEGPEDTPYFGGVFQIEINIPERYPMEPPRCQFITKVYHPNIDDQGRICLDILKTGSKGTWRPSLNIQTVLTSLRVLLAYPNPDDPLIVDIANEFKENQEDFTIKARDYTKRYAVRRTENSLAHDVKDGASSTNNESIRTKILAGPHASSSSSVSSSSSSATSTISSMSPPMSQTQPVSISTPEPLSYLFGLGLSSSISGPGRPLLAKRPALKKPSLSMRKPVAPSPNAPLSEPVISTEVVDASSSASIVANTSSHHGQQPESSHLLSRLSHTDIEAKATVEVVQDSLRKEDSLPTIPQARPMSRKRPSAITATTPSHPISNKKARAALQMVKVQEKEDDVTIIKAKNGISQSTELADFAITVDPRCSDMGSRGAKDHAFDSHGISKAELGRDSLPSNLTHPAKTPQIEVQSRFFVDISETIVETANASALEPVPAQCPMIISEPVPESIPEHTLDIISDTALRLPFDPDLDPSPDLSYHRVQTLASASNSETLHEPILKQDLAPEPKVEIELIRDVTRSILEPLEPMTEVKTQLDKGKGRAIEPEEVARKDFTQIPMVDTGMSRKTYVIPLSERQTNVATSSVVLPVPLTVARKRDLLKKRQPLMAERKVE